MEINKVDISDELRRSYLDYAMDVIVDRALPDARDGLKPVHRRVLYGMHMMHLHFVQNGKKTATVKSARVVGEVMGKYHPHGDAAIYDTMVRMAQPFSLRYPLVYGQGNFGSIDGDGPAAMRYTEVKLQQISDEILADLDKETVDLKKNYDSTFDIPDYVLPTRIPNLLANGSSGIAVGLATNIPTHNLTECMNASLALLDNPDITIDELMKHIPAPDFPTGAIIYGRAGARSAYHTGRGRIIIRSRCEVETDPDGVNTIVVTEIPYNVNKAEMVKQISALASEKKIEGIAEVSDVSSDTIRVEIRLKKNAFPQVVLNNLYKHTVLESSFSINMVAIVQGRPKTLNLKQALECFIDHRREVVTRRTAYLLSQARDRAHILEAMLVALDNMDEIVRIIRESQDRATAKASLMSRAWTAGACADLLARFGNACRPLYVPEQFGFRDGKYYLTETQTDRILDMRLAQLVKIAKDEVTDEYSELYKAIAGYLEILNSVERLHEVIREELIETRDRYGDARRSEIADALEGEISVADLVSPDEVIITLSKHGYVKYQKLADYRATHRGGQGRLLAKPKDDDCNVITTIANARDDLLLFTNQGRVYNVKVYALPEVTSSAARGRSIVNIIQLNEGERVLNIVPIKSYDENCYLLFATRRGLVKRSLLSDFEKIRLNGRKGLGIREGDEVVAVAISSGKSDVILVTEGGKIMRFNESKEEARRKLLAAKAASGEVAGEELPDSETELSAGGQEPGIDSGISESATGAPDDSAGDDTAGDEDGGDQAEGDENLRVSGRDSSGVKGIALRKGDRVVSMVVPESDEVKIFVADANGKGRRVQLDDIPIKVHRGGQGSNIGTRGNSSKVVGALQVADGDQILLSTDTGIVIRMNADEIRVTGRYSNGVKLIRLPEGASISAVERVPASIIPEDEQVEHAVGDADDEQDGQSADQNAPEDLQDRDKPESGEGDNSQESKE
ncbi:MAG: DNA gyrase subunit A [Succinivibrionaceae bacterium]|nr:DNA gyrase subunit A [Succinivibrionaceae bacterium]